MLTNLLSRHHMLPPAVDAAVRQAAAWLWMPVLDRTPWASPQAVRSRFALASGPRLPSVPTRCSTMDSRSACDDHLRRFAPVCSSTCVFPDDCGSRLEPVVRASTGSPVACLLYTS